MGFGDVLGDVIAIAVETLVRPGVVQEGSILESILAPDVVQAGPPVRNQPPLGMPAPSLGPSPGRSSPPITPIGGGPMEHFPGFPGIMPAAGFPFFDVVRPGGGASATLFRAPGLAGARPKSLVMVPNPTTGKPTFFKHAGTPILFSGDLRAARRVSRVAARARKSRR